MAVTETTVEGHELTNVLGRIHGGMQGHCRCGWWSDVLPDADAVRFAFTHLHLSAVADEAQPKLFVVR